ncbi:MAG TPA: hypothetical protein DCZ95_13835 [Verrucomicrobia bacterium]|nr:MAG: hypothetical protein A2X46_02040 [Lentisphaerae bacterium GWF2_57_35]HBA85165.1 hypothetical protein [Verrucomicrobiota bacterium]
MDNTSRKPLWAVFSGLSVLILGWMDWQTGYELNFSVFYFIPISVGAWSLGLGGAVILSLLSALIWFGADILAGHVYSSPVFAVWNTGIRLVSFLAMGWSVSMMQQALVREQRTAESLRRALSEVKVLESFLPICAQCKKIRSKEGAWEQLESYISQHANTKFSHGYCPECMRKILEAAGLTEKDIDSL